MTYLGSVADFVVAEIDGTFPEKENVRLESSKPIQLSVVCESRGFEWFADFQRFNVRIEVKYKEEVEAENRDPSSPSFPS